MLSEKQATARMWKAMRRAGFDGDSFDDIFSRRVVDGAVYAALLSELRQADLYSDPDVLNLGAALQRKSTDDVAADLIQLFEGGNRDTVREAAAGAMLFNLRKRDIGEVFRLVQNVDYGPARVLLLRLVSRHGGADGKELLKRLLSDPDCGIEAKERLRSMKIEVHDD